MQVKLKVLVGKNEGKEIAVPVKRFLIGRADDCHMRPKSDAISRNHCVILTKEDRVVLRDLNSRNGTFVNGERIDALLTESQQLGFDLEAVVKLIRQRSTQFESKGGAR